MHSNMDSFCIHGDIDNIQWDSYGVDIHILLIKFIIWSILLHLMQLELIGNIHNELIGITIRGN